MENAGTTLILAFVSIVANITEMMGVFTINQSFTIALSILSIVYLVFGIFIRAMQIKKDWENDKRKKT